MRLSYIDNILLLDLGANYMDEFSLSTFLELYAYGLCTFCLQQYRLKNIKEIFHNIPLTFTSCYQGGLSLWIFPFTDTRSKCEYFSVMP